MDKPKILMVDDEASILSSFKRLMRLEPYHVDTTTSVTQALELLRQNLYTLVISDQRMPEMDGAHFLEQVKIISPQSIRILLTGYSDIEAAIFAINQGEVYRFLTKPWKDEELKLTIREVIEQAEIKLGFMSMAKLLTYVNEKTNSLVAGHSKRVSLLSRLMAEKLNLSQKEIFQIEMASLLHDIGKIILPREVTQKKVELLRYDEQVLLKRHPEYGESVLSMIPLLKDASKIVRHHHETFDGNGFPDHLSGNNIPIGSRIVYLADLYDFVSHQVKNKMNTNEIMTHIMSGMSRQIDVGLVSCLKEVVMTKGELFSEKEIEIQAQDIKEGMVLSRDLKSVSGMMILSQGSKLIGECYARIIKFLEVHPFTEGIYVYK